jgi:hypothetical protein
LRRRQGRMMICNDARYRMGESVSKAVLVRGALA